MALFGRKVEGPATAITPAAEGWTMTQGERDGAPLLLRFNVEAATVGKAELPVRFGVAVRFRKPRRDGFPSDGDFEPLERIEDTILESLSGGRGVLAAVVTTGGMREFVGYVRGGDDVKPMWDVARAAAPGFDVQAYGKSDPEWQVYGELDPGS